MSKDGSLHRKFCDSLKKIKAPAFASLYVVKKTRDREVTIKTDHNTLLRFLVEYDAGRVVDLTRILRHVLMEISEVERCLDK